MKTILLNPGPVTLSTPVRAALGGPDLCHRETEFSELQQAIREQLLRVYALREKIWATVLLTGSGTAAVEAMIASLVPRDGHLVVVENGVYGERMHAIATTYGIATTRLSHAWGDSIDIRRLRDTLHRSKDITHLAVVHHETTTGRLNDLATVAALCRDANVSLLLDGVSSFGAENIDFTSWPLAACAATANKCLHGVPGISFVVLRRDALPQLDPPRAHYLSLPGYLSCQDRGGTPFTQSIQVMYALNAALQEFFAAGGQTARLHRYQQRQERVRNVLSELGVAPLLPMQECSCVLQAFALPSSETYASLHDALKARGFVIYAGQGSLAHEIFRISTMGEITDVDLDNLEQALRDTLARYNAP